MNAARANLIAPDQPLRSFRWSSWPDYLKAPSQRPDWLRVDRLLGEWRIPRDSTAGRRNLERQLENRRTQDVDGSYRSIRRGWCFGSDAFRRELLAQVNSKIGLGHGGEERKESQLETAERLIREELKKRKLRDSDLAAMRKGDIRKVEIAARLRGQTVMTVKWIADRLKMGSTAYVHNRLYLSRQARNQRQGK